MTKAKKTKPIIPPKCTHCDKPARKVSGRVIYPHRRDLWAGVHWLCSPCKAYVGSHKANGRPLGRPANAELRNARQHVHKVMDPIWQKAPDAQEYAGSDQDDKARKVIRMAARGRVYKWLAYKMGLDKYHTTELNIEQCREAYRLCRAVKYPEIRKWYKKES